MTLDELRAGFVAITTSSTNTLYERKGGEA